MPRTAAATLAIGACTLCLSVTAPVAHADAGVFGAIDAIRAQSGCSPLTHSAALDSAARDYTRSGVFDAQGYPGYTLPFIATGRPAASAGSLVMATAGGAIMDCKFVDAGVGSAPDGDYTVVGIVLGSIVGPRGAAGGPA